MEKNKPFVEGYFRFRDKSFRDNKELLRELGTEGQSPKTMVISCCDSRVSPSMVFDAEPGDLFTVRNVANLVPPYGEHGHHHGTSAAIEFAVLDLGIEHIVVMGHAGCGGIKACLAGLHNLEKERRFIAKWMSIAHTACDEALRECADQSDEDKQRIVEQASIINSLSNLRAFPFVKERMAEGKLELYGAYFDITSGKLYMLDSAGNFTEAKEDLAA